MGATVELKNLQNIPPIYRLLIYSKFPPNFETDAFSMNKSIAEELMKFKPLRRTMQLEDCFVKQLEKLSYQPIIKDIDVIFNPEYKVDVMKLLISAYKRKPFSLVWPGQYSEGKLIYSEEGFSDYKVYEIKDYDIMCVI